MARLGRRKSEVVQRNLKQRCRHVIGIMLLEWKVIYFTLMITYSSTELLKVQTPYEALTYSYGPSCQWFHEHISSLVFLPRRPGRMELLELHHRSLRRELPTRAQFDRERGNYGLSTRELAFS